MNRHLLFRGIALLDAVVLLVLPLSVHQALAMDKQQKTYGQIAPARPGIFAEQEEFEAAKRKGTVEAFEFFLKRHPNGSFACGAREALDRLKSREQPKR
jgi:hypothetical protein